MLVFTIHSGIYGSCWYLRSMLVFMIHAGIYDSCWYLRFMLVFTIHVGIYDPCWYLRSMLVFTIHAGIYDSCWYLRFMLVFTIHAGIYSLAVTVWTTAVKRFVLSSPGSRVGDKWLLSASGTTKGMNLITYSRCNAARYSWQYNGCK